MNSKHIETPTKAKIQGAVEFCEKQGISYHKEDVIRTFDVERTRGYAYLREGASSRRHHNNSDVSEVRGRHKIVTPKLIREMERLLEEEGMEARALTWEQLGFEVGLDCSGKTIQRIMGTMDYHKCIACRKGWVNEKTRKLRMKWSDAMLSRYPNAEDWKQVRFSDEVHFGWGPQGKLRIIRRLGERYCHDCIQEADEPDEAVKKRHHCWAAAGHDFKSDIYFYRVPGNSNGKMSQRVYIDSILEPIVKPWIEAKHDFVLEEDGDSGHGPGKSNIVRTWKQNNDLKHYFNCPCSPDLAPIENCWQAPKQYLKKYPHWDDDTTKGLIYEGWANVSQAFINERVSTMPDRLRAVLDGEGKMTGY